MQRGHPLSVEGLYCFVVQIFKNLKANASHKFVGRQHPLSLVVITQSTHKEVRRCSGTLCRTV